jgi:hypothetical protein
MTKASAPKNNKNAPPASGVTAGAKTMSVNIAAAN